MACRQCLANARIAYSRAPYDADATDKQRYALFRETASYVLLATWLLFFVPMQLAAEFVELTDRYRINTYLFMFRQICWAMAMIILALAAKAKEVTTVIIRFLWMMTFFTVIAYAAMPYSVFIREALAEDRPSGPYHTIEDGLKTLEDAAIYISAYIYGVRWGINRVEETLVKMLVLRPEKRKPIALTGLRVLQTLVGVFSMALGFAASYSAAQSYALIVDPGGPAYVVAWFSMSLLYLVRGPYVRATVAGFRCAITITAVVRFVLWLGWDATWILIKFYFGFVSLVFASMAAAAVLMCVLTELMLVAIYVDMQDSGEMTQIHGELTAALVQDAAMYNVASRGVSKAISMVPGFGRIVDRESSNKQREIVSEDSEMAVILPPAKFEDGIPMR